MSNEEETSNLCKPAISGLCVTHSKAILAVASAQPYLRGNSFYKSFLENESSRWEPKSNFLIFNTSKKMFFFTPSPIV